MEALAKIDKIHPLGRKQLFDVELVRAHLQLTAEWVEGP